MIRLKISLMGKNSDTEFPVSSGEKLSDAVERSLIGIIPRETNSSEYFVAVVNGYTIAPELWESVKLNSSDNVLIAPKISGGDSGNLFRMAAIIAISVVSGGAGASLYGAGTLPAGLFAAGATIAATMLLNALIPPPVPEGLDLGTGDLSSSQMYSISGQSNQLRKLQTVTKTYGTHRVFPAVAANPYTELETDPATGKPIQYFYAIYDFGLGPMNIRNIKIGDTPIGEFSDVFYKLVDFNKPEVSEGLWDDNTVNFLSHYKGRVARDTVAVSLNSDQGPSIPLSEYQAVRNASPNTDLIEQEIIVSLVCPSGLHAFSNSGEIGTRTIFLDIEFSKVGEDIWHGFNDPVYVSQHINVGGSDTYRKDLVVQFPPGWLGDVGQYSQTDAGTLYPETITATQGEFPVWGISGGQTHSSVTKYFGLLAGTNKVYWEPVIGVNYIGRAVRINGEFVGYVVSSTPLPAIPYGPIAPLFSEFVLDRPLTKNFTLWKLFFLKNDFNAALVRTFDDPNNVAYPWGFHNEDLTDKVTVEEFALGKTQISAETTSPHYATFSFVPRINADYKVRITRTASTSFFSQSIQDDLSWSGFTSRFEEGPIQTTLRHVFMEIKIRATGQLNGSIQNLSAECTSILNVYDGAVWALAPTSNPAWAFVDLLTGEVNKRPISIDKIEIDSVYEWAQFCDEVPVAPTGSEYTLPRFQTNVVIDYSPTLQVVLGQLAGAAQGSLNLSGGKYGVLVDRLNNTPIQIFTPRNSSGFSSTRHYSTRPHALKVSYIDPYADWEVRETIVYDDGYDLETATVFEEIVSYACTNPEQAWRFGRYALFQNRLRQETITIDVDFEHLVCTRGDYVQISQDVMQVGGSPARVKSISGSTVTIDDGIETGAYSYGYTFRAVTGEIYTNTLTVISDDTFTLAGTPLPAIGDLIIIGLVGEIVLDCIVKSIQPNDNMGATITLIERASEIYDSESTDVFPDYDPQIAPTANTEFAPPTEVQNLAVADYNFECTGNGIQYVVSLSWDIPVSGAYETFEISVDYDGGYELVAAIKQTVFSYVVETDNIGKTHNFKVIAVSATGKRLDLGSVGFVSQVASRKTSLPTDVEILHMDITGETIQFFWDNIPDCSCKEYLIRYSPVDDGYWDRSIPLLRASNKATTAFTQARTGVYLIKAVDFEDNESLNAAIAITTIPNLFGLNVIDSTTDFPGLGGSFSQVEELDGSLILDTAIVGGVDTNEYYSYGYYYYENFLDLGEIYSVRIQSQIQAEGFTLADLMSSWTTLSALTAMSHAGTSDWDVETQYRTTESFNVIADWITLSSIDPISEGSQDNWSIWRKFSMSDATGRIFQFRLKLISNNVSVTPRVFDGSIKSDMPDRLESFNNLMAPNTGYTVNYSPAFKGPGTSPNIQVTIDGASTGDYWDITSKTLNGFTIVFYDKNDVAVARTFDAVAKGFGRKATAII